MKETLIMVTLPMADGTTKTIENEELKKWVSFCENVDSYARLHNMNPPWDEIKWKITKPDTIHY